MKKLIFILLLMNSMHLQAQESVISDNSFLIEEAYNQEPRVIQHISNLVYSKKTKDWEYVFTHEWPLFSQSHQISYAIPYAWIDGNSVRGLGDIAINYRYQLWDDKQWAAFSPRVTVIIPTGNEKKELGLGKTAYQVNLPLSKRIGASWVAHFNAGATVTPGVSVGIQKQTLWNYNIGGSIIWIVKNNFNVMLEFASGFDDEISGGKIENRATYVISPGFRYAHNVGTLQIVPGLGVPIELNRDNTKSVFLYLSLEHPF
jgi:hypothetical protein